MTPCPPPPATRTASVSRSQHPAPYAVLHVIRGSPYFTNPTASPGDRTEHYTFSGKPYRSLQKIVAACKKHALLRDGKGEFLLQDPAKVFDHGSDI